MDPAFAQIMMKLNVPEEFMVSRLYIRLSGPSGLDELDRPIQRGP